MIIGISGYCEDPEGQIRVAGAGKDEVAKRLSERHGFVTVALADPIKRICRDVFDFSEEQLWGPSAARNAPDPRYLRGYVNAGHMLTEAGLKEYPDGKVPQYLSTRYALQQLGTEWGRACYADVWIDYGIRVAKRLEAGGCYYDRKLGLRSLLTADGSSTAFSDLRFFNEHKAVRAAGGKVIRIRRRVSERFDTNTLDHLHESERQLPAWDDDRFDYVIDNSGTLDHLGLLIDRMMDVFTGRIIPYDASQTDVPPFLRT